ncbi:MAG: glycosyltransferase family 2 protein [Lachnospiraceae bacterium]|nr:glycosyltransferase family 2 protein [Lachnospiraceae bacterium]
MHTDKKIDVCIPVYRPGEKYRMLLKRLSEQSVKINSVICMYTKEDGNDSYREKNINDCSLNILVREIEKKDFDHGRTRNEAVALSDADIVIMMTDDAVPCDNRLIEKLTEGLLDEKTAVCYARQMAGENSGIAEVFSREFNYPDRSVFKSEADIKTMGIKAFFCSNVCAAYKRNVFDELGGFVDRTVFNEDMIFARKVLDSGYRIRYEAEAKVIHSHDYSNMEQLRRNFDLAISQKLHPEVFSGISSESEGVRYVRSAFIYMRKRKKGYMIFPFIVTSAFKYAGYRLGKIYDRLPEPIVKRLTMNRAFFEGQEA